MKDLTQRTPVASFKTKLQARQVQVSSLFYNVVSGADFGAQPSYVARQCSISACAVLKMMRIQQFLNSVSKEERLCGLVANSILAQQELYGEYLDSLESFSCSWATGFGARCCS